jgi:hypothetical protein
MQWPLTSQSHGNFLKENNCCFLFDQTPHPYPTRGLPTQPLKGRLQEQQRSFFCVRPINRKLIGPIFSVHGSDAEAVRPDWVKFRPLVKIILQYWPVTSTKYTFLYIKPDKNLIVNETQFLKSDENRCRFFISDFKTLRFTYFSKAVASAYIDHG